eukprot:TRINITY_DN3544_c0_g1_i1.p1 TRINITY_DN3544_c0_g1~~TRINITY_DN3544_c0_g1_i1.p1  ORF type:complete len:813 (+),score=149.72 TRINITY_DN3544_c0_g1_i1:46-2484(+)
MTSPCEAGNFRFSYELKHDADVRCVIPYPGLPGGIVSASYDNSARLWAAGEQVTSLVGHTRWVAAVAYLPPSKLGPAMIATSGWDMNVVLWDLDTAQPVWILDGHTDKVTCMAVLPSGDLVTAGYDNNIVIWRNAQKFKTLIGHQAPVACVAAIGDSIVSGGAHGDCSLIRWSSNGDKLHQYKSHTSGVRGVCMVSDTEFVSCSNDTTLIMWHINGSQLQVFAGHINQVYSVAYLPTEAGGELVSVSEDRTCKIWNLEGACIQTISMPSFLFSVCCLDNGDIVVGCTDAAVRVFTRDPERVACEETLKIFDETVASQKINKGTMGGLDMATLPGPEALLENGTKDGQQKIIKTSSGAEVHCWNKALSKWEKIGDVVDGEGSPADLGSAKQIYKGKEWDYLFDVDLNDGKGAFKLPYNKGENPYAAAQRFIYDNMEAGITQDHLNQIADFITTNTGGAPMDDGAAFSDYAKEAAAQGGAGMSNREALKKLEEDNASVAFSEYAKEAAEQGKKTMSVDEAMKNMGDGSGVAFSKFAQEAAALSSGQSLSSSSAAVPEPTVSIEYQTTNKLNSAGLLRKLNQLAASEPSVDLSAIDAFVQSELTGDLPVEQLSFILEKWSVGNRFPVVDIIRQALRNPKHVKAVASSPTLSAALIPVGNEEAATQESLALKAASNLFVTPEGCELALSIVDTLVMTLRIWRKGTPALRSAFAVLLSNYSKLFAQGSIPADAHPKASLCVQSLSEGLLCEKDPDTLVRIIQSLGALILSPSQVRHTCMEGAKSCFLVDSFKLVRVPNAECSKILDSLTAVLKEDED